MKTKHLLLVLFATVVCFSCCQKDPSDQSGTTDKDQSYIQFMGQRFPLTDGEFSYGELSLYDENEAHTYEINIELEGEPTQLANGTYSLRASNDELKITGGTFELTENDSAMVDTSQVWLGEHQLSDATMRVSSADNVYTISINGMTTDGQEIRAKYVGRLYLDGKKRKLK